MGYLAKVSSLTRIVQDVESAIRHFDIYQSEHAIRHDEKYERERLVQVAQWARDEIARLEETAKANARRFDSVPILQAQIECCGKTRKVVVEKPTEKIPLPHITDGLYESAKRLLSDDGATGEILSCEDYEIEVVNRFGRTVATIPRKPVVMV